MIVQWIFVMTMVYNGRGVETNIMYPRSYNECKAIQAAFQRQADERHSLVLFSECVAVQEK